MDTQQEPAPTSSHLLHNSFNDAKRILQLFNDPDIAHSPSTVSDDEKITIYSTVTGTNNSAALNLVGHALRLITPKARLMLSEGDETVITLPADYGDEFPIHQVDHALQAIRNDLLNAMRQKNDGSVVIDTAKFKNISPITGLDLVNTLLHRGSHTQNKELSWYASEGGHELPNNVRFLSPSADERRPFAGRLYSCVDYKTYGRTMEHTAAFGPKITDELPQATGAFIEIDKKSFAALLQELGVETPSRQYLN